MYNRTARCMEEVGSKIREYSFPAQQESSDSAQAKMCGMSTYKETRKVFKNSAPECVAALYRK